MRGEIRSRRFRRRLAISDEPAENVPDTSNPERTIAVGRFYEILSRLRSDERIALGLHAVEGYTLVEIASAMGLRQQLCSSTNRML